MTSTTLQREDEICVSVPNHLAVQKERPKIKAANFAYGADGVDSINLKKFSRSNSLQMNRIIESFLHSPKERDLLMPHERARGKHRREKNGDSVSCLYLCKM